jgi:hypothetical protein
VCVCVCGVCVCVCVCVCGECVYVDRYSRYAMHECVYECGRLSVFCIQLLAYVHTYTLIHKHTHTHTHSHTHTHTLSHTLTLSHTHTLTRTQRNRLSWNEVREQAIADAGDSRSVDQQTEDAAQMKNRCVCVCVCVCVCINMSLMIMPRSHTHTHTQMGEVLGRACTSKRPKLHYTPPRTTIREGQPDALHQPTRADEVEQCSVMCCAM